jgi:hypothetical protein
MLTVAPSAVRKTLPAPGFAVAPSGVNSELFSAAQLATPRTERTVASTWRVTPPEHAVRIGRTRATQSRYARRPVKHGFCAARSSARQAVTRRCRRSELRGFRGRNRCCLGLCRGRAADHHVEYARGKPPVVDTIFCRCDKLRSAGLAFRVFESSSSSAGSRHPTDTFLKISPYRQVGLQG